MYACPICQQPLQRLGQRWSCAQNHSFDIAKENYVNLLPVQYKRSKNPGDNAEMMQARRAFLNQDHYLPLANNISQLLSSFLNRPDAQLLDLGCGEGYYTHALAQHFPELKVWGLDISKTAIRYAAKRYPSIEFSVASAYQLPFVDQSFDALVRIYAPSQASEIRRVLKPGGLFLSVQPAAKHLIELKQAIYQTPQEHDEILTPLEGFEPIEQVTLGYSLALNSVEDRLNLMNMTPFGWKLNSDQKQQLAQQLHLVSADFLIQLQRKIG